jgi:hypothetical protein
MATVGCAVVCPAPVFALRLDVQVHPAAVRVLIVSCAAIVGIEPPYENGLKTAKVP